MVGNVKKKPLEWPVPTKMVGPKQYPSWRDYRDERHHQNLKDIVMVIILFQLTCLSCVEYGWIWGNNGGLS